MKKKAASNRIEAQKMSERKTASIKAAFSAGKSASATTRYSESPRIVTRIALSICSSEGVRKLLR
jgi:hypothetical protein